MVGRVNICLLHWKVKETRDDKLPQRWARVPPALAWKRSGSPTEWTRVVEVMPADTLHPLPAGYVLLDTRKDRPRRS
jgi:hypothetical protein